MDGEKIRERFGKPAEESLTEALEKIRVARETAGTMPAENVKPSASSKRLEVPSAWAIYIREFAREQAKAHAIAGRGGPLASKITDAVEDGINQRGTKLNWLHPARTGYNEWGFLELPMVKSTINDIANEVGAKTITDYKPRKTKRELNPDDLYAYARGPSLEIKRAFGLTDEEHSELNSQIREGILKLSQMSRSKTEWRKLPPRFIERMALEQSIKFLAKRKTPKTPITPPKPQFGQRARNFFGRLLPKKKR